MQDHATAALRYFLGYAESRVWCADQAERIALEGFIAEAKAALSPGYTLISPIAASPDYTLAESVRELCRRCENLESEVKVWREAYDTMRREYERACKAAK